MQNPTIENQETSASGTAKAVVCSALVRLRKIYCFNNGGSSGWMQALAIAEDGHCVAGHTCSHQGYMRHDLGMDGSTWKHENYDKHFGAGNWELEWVDDPEKHEGLQKAYALNQLLAKESEPASA